MELKDTQPGDIVNFTYKQPCSGSSKRYLAKVISVRKLTQEEIIELTSSSDYRRYDGEFSRTETLVSCNLPGGKSRSFYAERSEACVKPPMGNVMYPIKDAIARVTGW
jgi:hypothetical protein